MLLCLTVLAILGWTPASAAAAAPASSTACVVIDSGSATTAVPETRLNLWYRYEQIIADSAAAIDAAISSIKDHTAPKDLQSVTDTLALLMDLSRLTYLSNRSYRLHQVLKNLQRLKSSPIKYKVVEIPGDEGYTAYDTASGVIVFYVVSAASFVHETTHGGQFEDGKIAFMRINGAAFGNDAQDEIEAYSMQFAFDPISIMVLKSTTVANSFATITESWLRHLTTPDGSMPYSDGGSAQLARRPITVDSDRKAVLKAYSFLPQLKQLPASWKITGDPSFFYRNSSAGETASIH